MIDRFDLSGRNALITGAAGLLGREHAFALAETGSNLILTDLQIENLNNLKIEVESQFPKIQIHNFEMDVTQEKSVQSVLSTLRSKSLPLNILINNAAIDPKVSKNSDQLLEQSRLENFSMESWNLQLAVGLTGSMICAKIFGSYMAENKSGVIVNIASDLSVMAPDQRLYKKPGLKDDLQPVKPVTYSVIKHGLIGLTKYLATYWADQGIRVNALSPGGVYNNHPEEFVAKLKNLIPMGRMAEKDEYRGCIQFLCSDASSYMTGQNLVVEGGRTAW